MNPGGIPVIGNAVNQGVGQLMSQLFTDSNQQQINKRKQWYDQLFPGTTSWERLGSSSSGTAMAGANVKDQSKENRATALQVASIGADAQRDVARINTGQQEKGRRSQYGEDENPKTAAEIEKIWAEVKLTDEKHTSEVHENVIRRLRAGAAPNIIARELVTNSIIGIGEMTAVLGVISRLKERMDKADDGIKVKAVH